MTADGNDDTFRLLFRLDPDYYIPQNCLSVKAEHHLPLSDFRKGSSVRLHSIGADADQAQRLREMGLCEGRCLSVIRSGERMIIGCGSCRIGIHRDLACKMYGLEEVQAEEQRPLKRLRLFERMKLRRLVS